MLYVIRPRKKGPVIFIAALCLLVFGSFLYNYINTGILFNYNTGGSRGHIPYAKQNAVLRELGITGYTDEQVADLEKKREEMIKEWKASSYDYGSGIDAEAVYDQMDQPYILLLSGLGSGITDYETWEWTPASSEVYAFDCEIFNLEAMYTDFIKGIVSICKGEFAITDVRQNSALVNDDDGSGTYVLTFQYNGHPYKFEAEANYDWIDVRIIEFMNGVFEKEGNKKRLLCTSDGGQGYILFYNTPEWGRKFTKKTRCPLSQNSGFISFGSAL